VKYWLKPDLENRAKAGEIAVRFGAAVERISATEVTIRRGDGAAERLPADRVYAMTGFHSDTELFQRMGIAFDATTGRPTVDPETLETTVPGVHVAGSVTAGNQISEIFIENGRYDGEKISATPRPAAQVALRRSTGRPVVRLKRWSTERGRTLHAGTSARAPCSRY
jgi:thioredoxin reductase (NADPH)